MLNVLQFLRKKVKSHHEALASAKEIVDVEPIIMGMPVVTTELVNGKIVNRVVFRSDAHMRDTNAVDFSLDNQLAAGVNLQDVSMQIGILESADASINSIEKISKN